MEQEGDSLFYDYFQKQSSGYSCKCCDEVLDSELLEGLVSHFKNCHPTEFKVAFVREYERKLAALHYWYKSMSTDEATLPLKTQIGIERAKCQDLYWNHLRQELLSSDEGKYIVLYTTEQGAEPRYVLRDTYESAKPPERYYLRWVTKVGKEEEYGQEMKHHGRKVRRMVQSEIPYSRD